MGFKHREKLTFICGEALANAQDIPGCTFSGCMLTNHSKSNSCIERYLTANIRKKKDTTAEE